MCLPKRLKTILVSGTLNSANNWEISKQISVGFSPILLSCKQLTYFNDSISTNIMAIHTSLTNEPICLLNFTTSNLELKNRFFLNNFSDNSTYSFKLLDSSGNLPDNDYEVTIGVLLEFLA